MAKAFPPDLGGVETYSEQVAFAYARRGFSPLVITQFDGPAGSEDRRRDGHAIRVLNVGAGGQATVFARMLAAVVRSSRQEKPLFAHATTWRVALPLLVLRQRPFLISVHGREIAQTQGAMARLMRTIMARSQGFVAISDYSRQVCSEIVPTMRGRTAAAWNGISWPSEPPRQLQQGAQPNLTVLVACQLTRRKNVSAAIGAISAARRAGVNHVRLVIAGDGPERARLEAMAKGEGVGDIVEFRGYVKRDKMPDLYRSADVFLHPHSHSHDPGDFESFCIAVADGMAFGLPVIAGVDGAPAEYIVDGVNGFLVDGSLQESVSACLMRAIALRPDERALIGQRARTFALENFNWDRHVEKAIAWLPEQRRKPDGSEEMVVG